MNTYYKLSDIAKWQLDADHSIVELPALQRGFVWKANQIESLWDSILRGFPVGSLLLSKGEGEKLFLLDGQQRATSIALGYYNPWDVSASNWEFLSLKTNVPVVWIDLSPATKTETQEFVIRVVTRSHPWGYQRINNKTVLSVSDRRKALSIFHKISENEGTSYIKLDSRQIFPYDSNLPAPLAFLIESINSGGKRNWKSLLIEKCKLNLPQIETKFLPSAEYFDKLHANLIAQAGESEFLESVVRSQQLEIPGIVIDREILTAHDDQGADDPTLFIRLNASGTRISGEELLYSIYKASFPEAKQLVENIGQTFVAPSIVISLIGRLAYSEINGGDYPYPMSVNEFRKRIKDENFRSKMKELIGDQFKSSAKELFDIAFKLLLSHGTVNTPPVLVKNILQQSPELLLMLLQWIKRKHAEHISSNNRILGTITALCWFGKDNTKYVHQIWNSISDKDDFWRRENILKPFLGRRDILIHPLLEPSLLRQVLLEEVVSNGIQWNNLYPSTIIEAFKDGLSPDKEFEGVATEIWNNFINKLFSCKSFILFAQRAYVNDKFGEFNQMATLEDTNTPWDWDHIYPDSWVYRNWYINANTKHWNNCIGNFRALSLEENRSESNLLSPSERLKDEEILRKSFISKEIYSEYWSKISERINQDNTKLINIHLSAIIHRMCDIYSEWYEILQIKELFDFEEKSITH